MHAFYGADHWLDMPMRWLRCYITMLPRLEAERSLRHVAEMMATNPYAETHERQRIIDQWQSAVRDEPEQPQTLDDMMAAMAAVGFTRQE